MVDPFSGSATTLAVAKKLGRHWLGFDLSAEYVERGLARLACVRIGDPLEGAPEPTMSAPATPESPRQRVRRPQLSAGKRRRPTKSALFEVD